MSRLFSLRFGLPAAILAVLLIVTGLSYLDRSGRAQSSLFKRAQRSAVVQAESIARLAQWDLTNDAAHVASELAAHATEPRLSSVVLVNSYAVVEMAHRSNWVGRHVQDVLPDFDIASFRRTTSGRLPNVQQDLNGMRIQVMMPFQTRYEDNEIRPVKRGVIYVEYDLRNEIAQVTAQARKNWLTESGLSVLLALILSWILHQRVSKPLVRVQEASERLAMTDEFVVRVPVSGPYEVRHLANAFNLMVAKLSVARQDAESGQARLVAIMDAAMDAIITTDTQQRVKVINKAAQSMFGYTESQAIGRSLNDFIPQRYRDSHTAKMAAFGDADRSRKHGMAQRQVIALRSDGEEFPVYAATSSLKVNGELLYTVILHDVTKALQAEAEIRELNANLESLVEQRTAKLLETTASLELQKTELEMAHAQLQTIFDFASTGIVVLKDRMVANCNSKAEEVFGYSPGEMIGLPTRNWYADEKTYQQNGELFYAQFKQKSSALSEVEMVRKDGSKFWARALGRVFRDTPGARELVVIIEDFTQQNEAKEMILKAKVDAESANLAKSFFLANMSHEIRTPMNGILGLAYILEKSAIPEEARQLVKKIRSTGADLQAIINDILDFSKIEGGHLELERADFDLGDVLERLANTMASNVGDKPIELAIVPPALPCLALQGDALRLLQVLVNITGNAVKFTQQGHVKIVISEVVSDDLQVALRFSVSDTGIGISKVKQAQIFTPFTQADASTTRRFGGSGLGLSISRHLVELMGGAIGVSSVEGKGSEFFFTLRFPRSVSSAPVLALLGVHDILVAGDTDIAREALQATARSLGCNSQVVYSGVSAVEYLKTADPATLAQRVLVLDSKTGPLDGVAAIRQLHALFPASQRPLTFMLRSQGHGEIDVQPEDRLVDGILGKPVTPASLRDAITKALRKRRGDSELSQSSPGRRLQGLRLLVVDDSDINREVSQRIFSAEGAEIVTRNDGDQALQWLLSPGNEVDLVLMDLQMPVMDGYDATREIRKIPRFAHLPVIALTAGAFQAQRDQAKAAGLNDFLSKPFDVDAAIALIVRYAPTLRQSEPPASSSAVPMPALLPGVARDLPGLMVGRGLSIWKDEAVYQRFLRKFAVDYKDCASVMRHGDLAQASRLAHKLLGAASNLALLDVAAAAAAIDQSVKTGDCPSSSLDTLQQQMDIALQSIAVFAPATDERELANAPEVDLRKVTELLGSALKALGHDSPDGVEPVLNELGKCLSPSRLTAIRAALDNFDFRGAEVAVRTLAGELEINSGAFA